MRVLAADGDRILQDLHAVFALILDVVDREHRFDIAEFFDVAVVQIQIYRHERRLPIVGVDNIRREVQIKQHL